MLGSNQEVVNDCHALHQKFMKKHQPKKDFMLKLAVEFCKKKIPCTFADGTAAGGFKGLDGTLRSSMSWVKGSMNLSKHRFTQLVMLMMQL